MSLSDTVTAILYSLIGSVPYLVAWIVAIVLSVIMLQRGGGRAERFLLAGSCVMFTERLFSTPISVIMVPWLHDIGLHIQSTALVLSGVRFFFGVVSLAGIVCLVYAFWVKFKFKSDA